MEPYSTAWQAAGTLESAIERSLTEHEMPLDRIEADGDRWRISSTWDIPGTFKVDDSLRSDTQATLAFEFDKDTATALSTIFKKSASDEQPLVTLTLRSVSTVMRRSDRGYCSSLRFWIESLAKLLVDDEGNEIRSNLRLLPDEIYWKEYLAVGGVRITFGSRASTGEDASSNTVTEERKDDNSAGDQTVTTGSPTKDCDSSAGNAFPRRRKGDE